LVQSRALKPIDTLMDAAEFVANAEVRFDSAEHGVASRFFSVTGQLRIGQATMQERSTLQRDGLDVKILSRTREVAVDWAPLQ
jgi:general secretion pathway protein K